MDSDFRNFLKNANDYLDIHENYENQDITEAGMLTLSLNSRDSIVNDEFNKRKFNIPSLDLEKILRPMIIEMQAAES